MNIRNVGKLFRWPFRLVQPQRIHSGEMPLECNECEKTFWRSSHIVQHQKIHLGETPVSALSVEKPSATA